MNWLKNGLIVNYVVFNLDLNYASNFSQASSSSHGGVGQHMQLDDIEPDGLFLYIVGATLGDIRLNESRFGYIVNLDFGSQGKSNTTVT